MKILITGANGLLGQKLVSACIRDNIPFLATSKGQNRNPDCPTVDYLEMDVTDSKSIDDTCLAFLPSHIIHTAALTNVDQCELEPLLCEELNVKATLFLIEAANKVGAHLQFISTDFIFDGQKGNYQEEDAPAPLSVYGQSKLDGERALIANSLHGWSIVRTIIVYGQGNGLSRSNLIVWAKGALEKGEAIKIIDDQFRAPTYADDLAQACLLIVRGNQKGVFHISGPQTYSIYEIVERIAKHFSLSMHQVERISSATLNQPARRPPKTGFDLTKAYTQLNYAPHTLEETLDLMFL